MNSLTARLLVAFLAVIAVVLVVTSLALLLLLGNSALVDRQPITRLTEAARLVLRQAAPPTDPAELNAYLQRIADVYEVRVLITDADGRASLDSQPTATPLTLNLRAATLTNPTTGVRTGRARDGAGDTWVYVARPVSGGRVLALALLRPRFPALTFFVEELWWPLTEAGGIGALIALLLAWLIARSVAQPLRQMAGVARGVAAGDYGQTAPVSGPEEVRALGQSINRMASQIQTTAKAQQDFLGNVSHELKTPLTSIQGFAQAIQDGAADSTEAIQRSASIIYSEADRMRRLVEELLDLTRLDAGLRAMRREPIEVRALLASVVEKFSLRAQDLHIALSVELPAELPAMKGDADRLAQVFTNLLDNALKHTPAGGRVILTAAVTPAGLQVSVADSGAGIPAADLGRIFERFYQVDKSRARPGGVGLGLAITREIVLAHQGTIQVESVVGLGSRFTVQLPLALPQDTTLVRQRPFR